MDVSGGYQRDSSAITIVDSYSTRVTAEFNCNYISTQDLAAVIYEIVSKWMPNAVVNIERNGGFGASVLSKLLTTSIKKNLFFTIKDKVIEERVMGAQVVKKTQKMKVYGSDSTHQEREALMEILRDRVEYHKDKIISKTIYDELCGLEVKKNGRIEHSTNTHDDQVFSWLWALYMWYNGGDLVNNWGIHKRVLRTDADLEEAVFDIQESKSDLMKDLETQSTMTIEQTDDIENQLKFLDSAPGKLLYHQWLQQMKAADDAAMQKILQTKQGREAYERQYHTKLPDNENITTEIPLDIFNSFNTDEEYNLNDQSKVDQGNLSSLWAKV